MIARVDEVLALFAAILRIAEVEAGKPAASSPARPHRYSRRPGRKLRAAVPRISPYVLWSIEPELTCSRRPRPTRPGNLNLIENAQRHSPSRTRLCRLDRCSTATHLYTVVDDGPGVPAYGLGTHCEPIQTAGKQQKHRRLRAWAQPGQRGRRASRRPARSKR